MILKLTLQRSEFVGDDVVVEADPTATVGRLAEALAERDPKRSGPAPGTYTIRVDGPGRPRVLDPGRPLVDAPVASGDRISLQLDEGRYLDGADERAAAAAIVVRGGPDEGQRFELRSGANQVGRGRGNDVELSDSMVSKRHARLNVGEVVEVLDLGSVNGVFIGDEPVDRAILRPGDEVLLGDTTLRLESLRAAEGGAGPSVPFNRSPYLDPIYEGPTFQAPEPPARPNPSRFPALAMVGPLLFGAVMYTFTRQLISVVFMALSPVMMIGMFFEGKRSARAAVKEGTRMFREALEELDRALVDEQADEVAARRTEHPSTEAAVAAALERRPALWARRPDRHGFGEVRLGVAALPTRCQVELPRSNNTIPGLWEELTETVGARATVDAVPVVASLARVGVIGVAGSLHDGLGAARSLVAQLTALHSPTELVLGSLLSNAAAEHWDWLKWLPHTSSEQSPIDGPLLAVGAPAATSLLAALRGSIEERSGGTDGDTIHGPLVVIVVDDAVPVDRSLVIELAERGPAAGIHLLWVAPTVADLPAAATAFVDHDPATHRAMAGFIDGGRSLTPVDTEPLDGPSALVFARSLAPVVDAGARADEASELPGQVSFLDQVGLELADNPEAVVDRWRLGDSLPTTGSPSRRRRKAAALHSLVGVTSHGPLQLDLRAHGPHALVGGTTGAGKSEFLQSWILGLAANHSPHRVTFLFVDYKGGAAFSECVRLPHTVGLVTDLTPHLVQRALASLNAELRHREHILNRKKAKDVLELEKLHDPETPPSLVIVVDEFAALVSEVPEFVDGVVNVAQRGRSLGLHLILATQRPAGVIKDNLRANTNLRVALRMADEADSTDVVGTEVAGGFSPAVPGRGAAKLGPGRLDLFQAAYVGGWTTGEAPPAKITVSDHRVGTTVEWPEPDTGAVVAEDPGRTDLERVVDSVVAAAERAAVPAPRKPWLPELAATYDLGRTPTSESEARLLSRTDERLVFGVLDDPAEQAQVAVDFEPDRDGNMAVIGTGGSGKSAFLRTLAVAGTLSTKGGPCHVYGLDFASRGLDMLAVLPNVGAVISGDDDERVRRLLRTLRDLVDERLARFAPHRADTISQYRRAAGRPDEARVVVLVDGFPAFRQEYEGSGRLAVYDLFQSIAADGRQVGVHVVISADRIGAVPSSLSSLIQQRLILRQAGESEYAMVGVSEEAFPTGTPPGRGFYRGHEVQVAVLGGTPDTVEQAAALGRLAELARARGAAEAPEIRHLPDRVALGDLPTGEPGRPVIAVADDTLGPFAVELEGPLVVTGPPKSGKSTTLVTVVEALRRSGGLDGPVVYVGEGRSAALDAIAWTDRLTPGDQLADRADALVKEWVTGPGSTPRARGVLVVDDAPRVGNWAEADRITDLAASFAEAGHVVLADGETAAMSSTWGLIAKLKAVRTGIVLVPDQYDGDTVFKTPFPKISRADFPPGRGFYVNGGRAQMVQIALPHEEAS